MPENAMQTPADQLVPSESSAYHVSVIGHPLMVLNIFVVEIPLVSASPMSANRDAHAHVDYESCPAHNTRIVFQSQRMQKEGFSV